MKIKFKKNAQKYVLSCEKHSTLKRVYTRLYASCKRVRVFFFLGSDISKWILVFENLKTSHIAMWIQSNQKLKLYCVNTKTVFFTLKIFYKSD